MRVADGTSFSTPLVSGAAALVKQKHPGFTAAQVKSALVNTASADVTHDDSGDSVDLRWLGGGKLAADAAVAANVTADPATISFGSVQAGAALPMTRQVTIQNSGAASVSLSLAVTPAGSSGGAAVTVSPPSVTLAAGRVGGGDRDALRIGSGGGNVFGRDCGRRAAGIRCASRIFSSVPAAWRPI